MKQKIRILLLFLLVGLVFLPSRPAGASSTDNTVDEGMEDNFPGNSPWLGDSDNTIYENPVDAKDEPDKITPKKPGMVEKAIAELFRNIASSLVNLMKSSLNATLDTIVYGRVGSGHPNSVNIYTFELRNGNPYGVTGSVCYSLIRGMCYVFMGIVFVYLLAKSAWSGRTAKAREELKSYGVGMAFKFAAFALMPFLLDVALYVRDVVLYGIKKVTGELITGGASLNMSEIFLKRAEQSGTFVDAIMYLGTVVLTGYFIFIYISIAMDMMISFVAYPAVTMFPKGKDMSSQLLKGMLGDLLTPVIDAVLLLIPLLTSLMLSNVIKGVSIIQLIMCMLIIPARGRVKGLLGLQNYGERNGFMGLLGATMLGRMVANKVKNGVEQIGNVVKDAKHSARHGELAQAEKEEQDNLASDYRSQKEEERFGMEQTQEPDSFQPEEEKENRSPFAGESGEADTQDGAWTFDGQSDGGYEPESAEESMDEPFMADATANRQPNGKEPSGHEWEGASKEETKAEPEVIEPPADGAIVNHTAELEERPTHDAKVPEVSEPSEESHRPEGELPTDGSSTVLPEAPATEQGDEGEELAAGSSTSLPEPSEESYGAEEGKQASPANEPSPADQVEEQEIQENPGSHSQNEQTGAQRENDTTSEAAFTSSGQSFQNRGKEPQNRSRVRTTADVVHGLTKDIEAQEDQLHTLRQQKAGLQVKSKQVSRELLNHEPGEPAFDELKKKQADLGIAMAKVDQQIQFGSQKKEHLKRQLEQAKQSNGTQPVTDAERRRAEILRKQADIHNFESPDFRGVLSHEDMQRLYRQRAIRNGIKIPAKAGAAIAGGALFGSAGVFVPKAGAYMAVAGAEIGSFAAEQAVNVGGVIKNRRTHEIIVEGSGPGQPAAPGKPMPEASKSQPAAPAASQSVSPQPNAPEPEKPQAQTHPSEPAHAPAATKPEPEKDIRPKQREETEDAGPYAEKIQAQLQAVFHENGTIASTLALKAMQEANIKAEKYFASCRENQKTLTAEQMQEKRVELQTEELTEQLLTKCNVEQSDTKEVEKTKELIKKKIRSILEKKNKNIYQ